MNRLGLNGLLMSVAGVVVLGASVTLGCESSSNDGTTTPEAGTTPDTGTTPPSGDSGPNPDAAACGKLPPTGLSQVVQPKTGTDYGQGAVLTLDKKGRPLFAFLDHTTGTNPTLYVVRWDDCTGAWLPPVKVDDDILGDVGAGSRLVAISTDPSDGRIGIAYEKRQHLVAPPNVNDSRTLWVATSADDGASFTKMRVSEHKGQIANTSEGDHKDIDNPAIALGGGKTYVAYNQIETACGPDGTGCLTATVLATGQAGVYTYDLLKDSGDPNHNGAMSARSLPIGLAIDSDGIPGVVAHVEPATGYNTIVAYYKPGFTTYKPILDSNGVQNDDGAASLAYDGKKPRVVTRIQRGAIGATTDYTLLFSASDDGTTWAAPVPLPEIDNHAAASEKILVSGGKVLVVAGGPRSWKSSDLTTFVGSDLQSLHGSVSVSEVLGADGKQWVGFDGTTPFVSTAEGGVVLYRE